MFTPSMLTGMEQQYITLRYRVIPDNKCTLKTVAAKTGEGKIRRFSRDASRLGHDVFYRERIGVKTSEASTILALSFRPFRHRPHHCCWNVSLCHDSGQGYLHVTGDFRQRKPAQTGK